MLSWLQNNNSWVPQGADLKLLSSSLPLCVCFLPCTARLFAHPAQTLSFPFSPTFYINDSFRFRWEQIDSITSFVNLQEWMVWVCGRHSTHYVLYLNDTDKQVGQVLSTIAKTPCISLFVMGLCHFLTCCLGVTQDGKGSIVDFKHYEHVLNIIIFGIEKKNKSCENVLKINRGTLCM